MTNPLLGLIMFFCIAWYFSWHRFLWLHKKAMPLVFSLTFYSDMDGSYIGTTFPHLYLMTYPSSKPTKPAENYVPRVFGFKLHKGPRW